MLVLGDIERAYKRVGGIYNTFFIALITNTKKYNNNIHTIAARRTGQIYNKKSFL